MSPKRAPVLLSRSSFISLGLVCTLLSAAFNLGVTWMRISSIESLEDEHSRRLTALEALTATHTTGLAVIATQLQDIDKTLARIDGRLSGTLTVKARGTP